MIDLASDLNFILADAPGSVLIQCGAQSGPGIRTDASKMVDHRVGNLDFQGSDTVIIFNPAVLTEVVKNARVMVGGMPCKVTKPVSIREDGSAIATVEPA